MNRKPATVAMEEMKKALDAVQKKAKEEMVKEKVDEHKETIKKAANDAKDQVKHLVNSSAQLTAFSTLFFCILAHMFI